MDMPESVLKVLQFGALGLLAIVLVFGLLTLQKVATRMIVAFDKLSDAVTKGERDALQRHHETTDRVRIIVAEYAMQVRDEIRNRVDGPEIVRAIESFEQELREHVNDVAEKIISAQGGQSEATRDHVTNALRPIEYRVLRGTPMPFSAPRAAPKESDR